MLEPRIKKYMENHGIKQTYITKATGISKDRIHSLLSGKSRLRADELFAICDALEVPVDYFRYANNNST